MNPQLPFPPSVLFIIYIWSIIWKGFALWAAARGKQKNWFIVLVVLNTAGIMEIIFLFFFAKEKITWSSLKF